MDYIYNQHHTLLEDLDQPWLLRECLKNYAAAIHSKGATLSNCWGFVDSTVRPVCRPRQNQRTLYNGHKRVHSIKFQSVVAPNGMIANLFGPVEGKRHDSGLLAISGLLPKLPQYGLTPREKMFNTSMSRVWVVVEWVFGDIINYFKFLDFKKNLKVGLSAIGKMYISCALIQNAHTCLYENNVSKYFNVQPPTLEQYFRI